MKAIMDFLKQTPVFYLTTTENNNPKVRPFSSVMEFNDKLYFITGNHKDLYKQLQSNPRFELCSLIPSSNNWLRLSAKAVFDNNHQAKERAFEVHPSLAEVYKTPKCENLEVFYASDIKASFYAMTNNPWIIDIRIHKPVN